jgi:hypothetical protein
MFGSETFGPPNRQTEVRDIRKLGHGETAMKTSTLSTSGRKTRTVAVLAAGAMIMATTGGCNNAGEGALSGGALGALAGMGIGSLFGKMGAGAAGGAIIGAVGGAVLGDQNQRNAR